MNPLNLYDLDLPNGWTIEKLSNFVDIIMGQSPLSETYNRNGEGLPFFQGKAEFGEVYPTVEKYCSEPIKIASQGDVLLSVRAPVGPTNLAPQNCCIGRGLASLHPLDNISSKFILYLFRTLEPQISKEGTGSTFKAINKQFIENLAIALPPLKEQIRIVDKIEENFSELDKGVEYLKTVQKQLKAYRQSVLKYAFEGKLTEQWRKAHADQLETADQLLERIHQARESLYQQQLNEWEEAVKSWTEHGKKWQKLKKPSKFKKLTLLEDRDIQDLPNLPNEWQWVKLGQITEISGGVTKNPERSKLALTVSYLRVANVYANRLDLSEINEIGIRESELPRVLLQEGDLLIVEGNGSIDQIGRVAIWHGEISPCVHQNHLIKSRPLTGLNGKCILYFLLSLKGRELIKEQAATTSGLYTLSLSKVEGLSVPLMSFVEQNQIIEEIESRLSISDQLEAEIEANLKKAEVLHHSILKKAFSGRLVLQDPNDEPASILLERIRAERLATPAATRKTITSRKKLRKKEVMDLVSVLESTGNWLSAQDAFRECGISDGAETEVIEKLFLELRDLEKEDRIEVERRGDEDWLRIRSTSGS